MSDRKGLPPSKFAPVRERTVKIDVHTEQVVLAAMIVDPITCRRMVRMLPPERWQVPEHRAVVVALAELDRRQVAYDPAAVKRLYPDVDVNYLAQLVAERPEVPVDLAHYVEGVRWDGMRADAVRGPIAALIEAIADPLSEPAKVRGLARAIGDSFGAWRDRARVLHPDEVISALRTELEAREAGHAIFPFGIEGLDIYQDEDLRPRLIPAAKPGKITIITGTSGSGKSTLACRIALGQARQKRRTLFGAWEMSANESIELLAVMSLAEEGQVYVSRTALQTGRAGREMTEAVIERATQIGKYVRFVPNPFQRAGKETNDENLDIIQHLIEDMGADVFIADLWERCLVQTNPDDIQSALYRQQGMCDRLKCHGILLQQQRLKDVEARADRRPTREGIKGTSAWIDIGDTILGAYRPAQWKAVPDDLLVIDVLKQRHAPWPLSVEIAWDPDKAWFGQGQSVPYDQPSGKEGPDEIAQMTSGGGKKKGGRSRG